VVKSLEASLWAFHNAGNFEEAVLRAVNLGDDADTTGAICGQLAGAFWGESQIPESLRSGLAQMDMIESACSMYSPTRTGGATSRGWRRSSNRAENIS
jgi:ADP-ribosyl-[dinitrogen reductase] hydrolase